MAPLVESFPATDIEKHINRKPDGKARKPPVKLDDCEMKQMSQYFCELNGPREDPKSRVVCEEFLRKFRRCGDGLIVETTSWEREQIGGG